MSAVVVAVAVGEQAEPVAAPASSRAIGCLRETRSGSNAAQRPGSLVCVLRVRISSRRSSVCLTGMHLADHVGANPCR